MQYDLAALFAPSPASRPGETTTSSGAASPAVAAFAELFEAIAVRLARGPLPGNPAPDAPPASADTTVGLVGSERQAWLPIVPRSPVDSPVVLPPTAPQPPDPSRPGDVPAVLASGEGSPSIATTSPAGASAEPVAGPIGFDAPIASPPSGFVSRTVAVEPSVPAVPPSAVPTVDPGSSVAASPAPGIVEAPAGIAPAQAGFEPVSAVAWPGIPAATQVPVESPLQSPAQLALPSQEQPSSEPRVFASQSIAAPPRVPSEVPSVPAEVPTTAQPVEPSQLRPRPFQRLDAPQPAQVPREVPASAVAEIPVEPAPRAPSTAVLREAPPAPTPERAEPFLAPPAGRTPAGPAPAAPQEPGGPSAVAAVVREPLRPAPQAPPTKTPDPATAVSRPPDGNAPGSVVAVAPEPVRARESKRTPVAPRSAPQVPPAPRTLADPAPARMAQIEPAATEPKTTAVAETSRTAASETEVRPRVEPGVIEALRQVVRGLRAPAEPRGDVSSAPLRADVAAAPDSAAEGKLPTLPLRGDALAQTILARARMAPQSGRVELRFALSPPELGSVKIRITARGEHLRVELIAGSQQAADALNAGLPRLSGQLNQAGYTQAEVTLGTETNSSDAGHHAEPRRESATQRQRGGPAEQRRDDAGRSTPANGNDARLDRLA